MPLENFSVNAQLSLTLALVSSTSLYFLPSWRLRKTKIGMICGASFGVMLISPFVAFAPISAIFAGLAGGFAAFMIQKKAAEGSDKSLAVGLIVMASTFAIMSAASYVVENMASPHMWYY